jgi:hypothetical protein
MYHSDIWVFCCSSKDVILALLYAWDLGDSAVAAQQALVRGLTNAMFPVLHTLPPKGGSTSPTALQVLAGQETMMHICDVAASNHTHLMSAWATFLRGWPDCN